MMEMLQKAVQSNSQPIRGSNVSGKEAYGYAGGQGSPTPGETASPKSYFLQSPSLPDCGLTEFSSADATRWDLSPDQPQKLPATRDRAFINDAPPKRYVGVRVKMPVRELLKNIRLSKGIDSNHGREASVKVGTKETLGTKGEKRASSEMQRKLNRHNPQPQPATKSMEDLDILVEVLEEDLNKSCSRLESQVPRSHLDGASPQLQLPWWETDGNRWPDGNRLGNSCSTRFQQHCPFPGPGALWHGYAKHLNRSDDKTMQPCPDPITMHLHSHVEARQRQGQEPFLASMGNFQGFAGEVGLQGHHPPGNSVSEPLDNDSAVLHEMGQLKPKSSFFQQQDTSAISFFQFQLYQEESWLRSIPQNRMLAPDPNGNRPLHKAVAQGKRALAYALAWRLALLNRIDEEDARKQTALHVAAQKNHHLIVRDLLCLGANVNKRDGAEKTLLHLCAEKGYSRVLEVLRNCQKEGTHLDVDATDNQGFTPLQCAAVAHSAVVMNLGRSDISPEARELFTLRKGQIWSGIACLLEMGADPWVQGTKSSIQVSDYLEKVQENNKLVSFLQAQKAKWQEDPATFPGPDGLALSHVQQDLEPPLL